VFVAERRKGTFNSWQGAKFIERKLRKCCRSKTLAPVFPHKIALAATAF
jgi:hypothetical protein